MTDKGFGVKPEIPEHYKSVQWVLDNKCPGLKAALLTLIEIKTDGAVDEIPSKEIRTIKKVLNFYINLKAQRVDEINEGKILENITREKGFSHEEAGTISYFLSEKYSIDICPDGMHRLIKALLCGVEDIAATLERILEKDLSDEEMTRIEGKFLRAQNSHNAQMSTAEKNKKDKESDNMSDRQKEYDEVFTKAGIHVHGYGLETDGVIPTYINASHEDWFSHLNIASSASYVGVDDFNTHSKNVLIKYGTSNKAVDIPLSWLCVNLSTEVRTAFIKWLGTNDFKGKDKDWWFKNCIHGKFFQTATIRLLCAFNQHHRKSYDKNIVTMEMITFLRTVGVEAHHFVDNCLNKNQSIESVDAQVAESTFNNLNNLNNLNKTKESLDKVFNTP